MARRSLTEEQLAAKREREREYNSRPEVKARKKASSSTPEAKAARKAYYARPDVKERYKLRRDDAAHREYCKQWRRSETGRQKLKESGLRLRGFTLKLWNDLLSFQGGACAICRKPFPEDKRGIHADHCHETGVPRGLLCQPCNHAEGQIKKTGLKAAEFAARLSAYLEKPATEQFSETLRNPALSGEGEQNAVR
jgi:hypothetical protein